MDQLLHYIVHLDEYLTQAVEVLGLWAYVAIFPTIFAETGLVVAPFLPGESLLLASGTLAGAGCCTSPCCGRCSSGRPFSATSSTT